TPVGCADRGLVVLRTPERAREEGSRQRSGFFESRLARPRCELRGRVPRVLESQAAQASSEVEHRIASDCRGFDSRACSTRLKNRLVMTKRGMPRIEVPPVARRREGGELQRA